VPRLVTIVPALFLASCSQVPQYPTSVAWQNKDVLLIRVHVDDELETSEYRAIAQREAARQPPGRESSSVPLYEIRCEFVTRSTEKRASRRLATVRLFPGLASASASTATAIVRTHTVVY
jgi:hypothetical protein